LVTRGLVAATGGQPTRPPGAAAARLQRGQRALESRSPPPPSPSTPPTCTARSCPQPPRWRLCAGPAGSCTRRSAGPAPARPAACRAGWPAGRPAPRTTGSGQLLLRVTVGSTGSGQLLLADAGPGQLLLPCVRPIQLLLRHFLQQRVCTPAPPPTCSRPVGIQAHFQGPLPDKVHDIARVLLTHHHVALHQAPARSKASVGHAPAAPSSAVSALTPKLPGAHGVPRPAPRLPPASASCLRSLPSAPPPPGAPSATHDVQRGHDGRPQPPALSLSPPLLPALSHPRVQSTRRAART